MPNTQATLPFWYMIIKKHLKQRPQHCNWPHCKPAVLTFQQNRSVLCENEQEHDHQRHKALCGEWPYTGHVSCFHTFLNLFNLEQSSSISGPDVLKPHHHVFNPPMSGHYVSLHHRSRKVLSWHWLWQKHQACCMTHTCWTLDLTSLFRSAYIKATACTCIYGLTRPRVTERQTEHHS